MEVLSSVIKQVSQPLKDLIVDCSFLGEPCDLDAMFTAYAVPTGTCYTFNERNPTNKYLTVAGGGFRHSLQLVLNIQSNYYVGSPYNEAGVLVSIHEQGAPPLIWESGVAIPVGHSAYLSVTRNEIEDLTYRQESGNDKDCVNNPSSFRFVQSYEYSYRACRIECILSQIADECYCTPDFDFVFGDTKNCTISDLCCILSIIEYSAECPCPVLCHHTSFDVIPSYSTFLAKGKTISKYNFSSVDDAMNNLLQIRVFFGGLSIHREITVQSYSLAALIANIGGNMGLFLGASIISLTEFLALIFDGVKDRLCGIRERKIKELWSSYKLKNVHSHESSTDVDVGGYSVYTDCIGMDISPAKTDTEPLS